MIRTLITAIFLSFLTNNIFSQIIHVDSRGYEDLTCIQEGIDAATSGDTVLVYPGIYYENINFHGKDITVASLYLIEQDEAYIHQTIIDGNQGGTTVLIPAGSDSTTLLCGFTIRGGTGSEIISLYNTSGGIGIRISKPEIRKCIIKDNTAHYGGGIYCSNSQITLSGVTICNNHSYIHGGGISLLMNSTVHFDENNLCNIYLNYSSRGCDFHKSPGCPPIEITVDTFTVINPGHYYLSSTDPNGYYLDDITTNIQNAKIETVNSDLYVDPDGSNTNSGLTQDAPLKSVSFALGKIISDSLHPNTIHIANGIYSPSLTGEKFPFNCRSYITFNGENVDSTILDSEDMAFFMMFHRLERNISFKDLTFVNGNGNPFFAYQYGFSYAYENENLSFENIVIKNCKGTVRSAMITGKSDNLIINGSEIIENIGGMAVFIYNSSPDTNTSYIINTKISQNSGDDNPEEGYGGGISIHGSTYYPRKHNCIIINTEITNNLSNYIGGNPAPVGLAVIDGAKVDLINCTIGNNEKYSINGSAVSVGTAARIDIYNSIIYNPIPPWEIIIGTWVPDYISKMSIYNSLIRGEEEYFYIGGNHEILWGDGNIDTIPMWVGEGDYPYTLLEGSPCIDAGTLDIPGIELPEYDLAGNPRIVGDAIDIGAYEFQDSTVFINENIPGLSEFDFIIYPNPSKGGVAIDLIIKKAGRIRVEIYSSLGQRLRVLMDASTPPGHCKIIWDGTDDRGNTVNSGHYVCRVIYYNGKEESKLFLVK